MNDIVNSDVSSDYNQVSLKNPMILVSFITSSLLTAYLFYLDEGYYSFKWMLEPGAWVIYAIYVFIFFSVQVFLFGIFYNIIPNLFKGKLKHPAIGIISILGLIFSLGILYYIFS